MDHLTQKAIDHLKAQLQKNGTIKLAIKITPKSKSREISGIMADGTIKVKLRSAPKNNKANEELIEFLSEMFGVSENNIRLISGEKIRRKILMVKIT